MLDTYYESVGEMSSSTFSDKIQQEFHFIQFIAECAQKLVCFSGSRVLSHDSHNVIKKGEGSVEQKLIPPCWFSQL